MTWSASALVAETYDVLRPLGHSYGDVEFYDELLRDVSGTVLELACGTGRILARLAAHGVDIEGLDHCADTLQVCRRNCEQARAQAQLHHADMRSFDLGRQYAAIIVPAGSIRGAGDVGQTRQTLLACARALQPGGLLAVDLEPHTQTAAPGSLSIGRRDNRMWTVQLISVEHDPVHQRSTELLRYERWCDGALEVCELHQFALQHWAVAPFAEFLQDCGFAEPQVHANYQIGRAPAADDRDWTFITRWPGEPR